MRRQPNQTLNIGRVLGRRGRPRMRWHDDLDLFQVRWSEIAGDGDSWKEMAETFAQPTAG